MSMEAAKAAGLGPATLWLLKDDPDQALYLSRDGWLWGDDGEGMTAEEVEVVAIEAIRLSRETLKGEVELAKEGLAEFEASLRASFPDVVT